LRETQPAVAAEAHRAIADQLQASGYPGHAEIFRHRAGEDLLRAGDPDGGFDLFWQLGFDGLLRGDTHARLPELANWTLPPPGGVRQAKLTVLRAALNWYGQGSNLTATTPALRALLDADDCVLKGSTQRSGTGPSKVWERSSFSGLCADGTDVE
jgi:hypothetical protein